MLLYLSLSLKGIFVQYLCWCAYILWMNYCNCTLPKSWKNQQFSYNFTKLRYLFGKLHTVAMLGDVYVCSQGWGFLLKFSNLLHFSICHHNSILNDIHRKAIASIYRWIRELPAVTKKQCKDWFQTDFSTVYRLPELAFYLLNILSLYPWIQCVDSCCISQGQKFKRC